MEIKVLKSVLEANDVVAEQTRELLDENGVRMVNVMGGPGCGKTTLLERVIPKLGVRVAVIEGDIRGTHDAERVSRLGVKVIQINTEPFGGECHLEASAVRGAIGEIELDKVNVIFVENVGNLVCPAEFKIGDHLKVVMVSVSEGDDKPAKYPLMFRVSDVCVLSKSDLLSYVNFDEGKFKGDLAGVNFKMPVFKLSARTGEGVDEFVGWLRKKLSL